MFKDPNTKIYDGDYEVIFSDSFNVYENRLLIKDSGIAGYSFEIIFDKEQFSALQGGIFSEANNEEKKITITIKKFRNNLGAGSTGKLPIINLEDGRKIFFSIYGKSLSNETDFLNVTVSFYLK